MTGLAFLGLLGRVEIDLKKAKSKMERRKAAIEEINAMHNDLRVTETRDVTRNETRMLEYFEAVDEVARLLDKKNRVIDQIEEKLSLLQTPNGEEVIRGRYIEYKKMETIAFEMNYSRPGIYKLLDRAMAEFDQVLADYDWDEAMEDYHRYVDGKPAHRQAM